MRYFRARTDGDHALVAVDGDESYDLTRARPELERFADLARTAAVTGHPIDDIARRLLPEADPIDGIPAELMTPVRAEEVWAAGVTYEVSEQAREGESAMPEMYFDVYEAERPELFFKATAARTVGPGGAIGIRGDSSWDVPEPELGVVLHRGTVVGYTVGNDVSSRAIEGANPLYLPQAKVYDRSCAIGPCVASPETVDDPLDLDMRLEIVRDGATVFDDSTSTANLVRRVPDLVEWLAAHNRLPETTVLLTGTALVPPDDFTLHAGDRVRIEIEGIGTLENPVVVV